MIEPERTGTAPAAHDASDADRLIDSLRAEGADRFDPVRLRYIEALARRAAAQEGAARRLLDARLAQALAAFRGRLDAARCEAGAFLAGSVERFPQAAKELERLFGAGDYKEMRRLVRSLEGGDPGDALRALVRLLEHQPAQDAGPRPAGLGSRPELKTIRNFRDTWSKLSVGKQVTQALEQAPRNAGPINSHMLVLRSLALMRDISPDYLNRFLSYADALLCLDRCEREKPAAPRKTPARTAKK